METLIVINAVTLSPYALLPRFDGECAFGLVCRFARELAGQPGVLVLTSDEALNPDGLAVRRQAAWSMQSILQACADFAAHQPSADALLYLQADSPLYDPALTERLLAIHRKYRAEYTFADGYPAGFAPEILRPTILPSLVLLAERNPLPVDRDSLFAVLQKDINSYDIETELSPLDVRAWRFAATCDNKRNLQTVEGLWRQKLTGADQLVAWLPQHPELLRTLPAFLWVQISSACPQSCSYCPYPAMVGDPRQLDGHMPVGRFTSLLADAVAVCDDLVVDVSLWGDPVRHPDFGAIAEAVLSHPHTTLLVETAGLGWPEELVRSLQQRWPKRLHWIVSLDSTEPALYQALRGDGFAEAQAFAARLGQAFPGQVHYQAVRMHENEENLENFYRSWIKLSDTVIIQKYDSFAGTLPDRQVADLAPLERLPCRHLARDMAILLDGGVPPCKHCLARQGDSLGYPTILANVFEDGFLTAWQRQAAWYERHCRQAYPEPCRECDEYHTFNA